MTVKPAHRKLFCPAAQGQRCFTGFIARDGFDGSSNSYWQMSRTPVINQAISNAWLKEQGLLSVKDLWCKVQGYTGKKRKTSSSVPTC